MITLHFFFGVCVGGGEVVPDMPHSFGCEATDWHRDIWTSCKRFRTGVSVVIFMEPPLYRYLKG